MIQSPRKTIGRLLQSGVGARLVLEPVVVASYRQYLRSGRTPSVGYSAMRKLFGSPRTSCLEALADRSVGEQPLLVIEDPSGIITDPAADVVEALRRDGVVQLGARLPELTCAALTKLATSAVCTLTERVPGAPAQARFDAEQFLAVRYDVPEAALVESEAVQGLLADRSVLAIAQSYLGGVPVQDLAAMWWTGPSRTSSSAAAQQFHFDLDRLRFLKLFVYLTDVGPDNGPHMYVRGSHRSLPVSLRADRRFTDAEVLEYYGEGDIVSVMGPRGSMFLADTRGLHKGAHSTVGNRLVFQLEYATSLFGAPVRRVAPRHLSWELSDAVADFPASYRRFDRV